MLLNLYVIRLPWRSLVTISVLILLILAGNLLTDWIAGLLNFELLPSNEDLVHRMIMTLALVYAVLMAIPYVPGVEIGLALIAVLGPPIVFLVYMSTVVGLAMSFALGRIISLRGLIKFLREFRLHRTVQLLEQIEPMSREERLAFLATKAPARLVPFLLRHRYVALAVLLNLPGNFIVGGGGGIAMVAGVSGLYAPAGYLVTVGIAVSPVPLAVLYFGNGFLAG
jgi:hypothetical protein